MISGSAFQVSAADFFGFSEDDEAEGPEARDWVRSLPMRFVGLPGSLGTLFFRCGVLSEDYSAVRGEAEVSERSSGKRTAEAGVVERHPFWHLRK